MNSNLFQHWSPTVNPSCYSCRGAAPSCTLKQVYDSLSLLELASLAYGASAMFEVKASNGTVCIKANFSAAFWTSYETGSGSQNATFPLPSSAHVLNSNSSCGGVNASEPSLAIAFGGGHSLTLQFTRNATRYRVRLLHFVYNLGDTDIFPNASSKEVKAEDSMTDILADIDKKYRCVSATQVHMQNVTITLSDTTIEAYLSNGNFSKGETRCKQDLPSPTSVPPAPPKPPTPPSPTPPSPTASTYNVSGNNGTCLLARMGLQLNVTYSRKDNTTMTRVVNINPNVATAMGSCSANLVSLEIRSEDGVVLGLNFRMVRLPRRGLFAGLPPATFCRALNSSANRFFLETVKLNMTVPDAQGATVQAANNSLRALQATVGNSYKCTTEERLRVTPSFFLNLFSVQVQAFKVEGNKFGSAEVCLLDGNNMLIPIAVGGALAGLVLVVLLAYLIGRKRSHAGYQTI
ncbi:lysosome-associated membrane glycoprotein 1 [Fukomys damarensis]|uniref:lysosome-associated membrane glycoprotein 1 n=1 Tax=Fukomys damarensis TaxID=885580 RepID=UPI0014551BA6|nr:lysosome-associated membrane glycoprotein 1 [Fukomys damarensis]